VCFVLEVAQVELKSERVKAPARGGQRFAEHVGAVGHAQGHGHAAARVRGPRQLRLHRAAERRGGARAPVRRDLLHHQARCLDSLTFFIILIAFSDPPPRVLERAQREYSMLCIKSKGPTERRG
jgi:hypothetical protein